MFAVVRAGCCARAEVARSRPTPTISAETLGIDTSDLPRKNAPRAERPTGRRSLHRNAGRRLEQELHAEARDDRRLEEVVLKEPRIDCNPLLGNQLCEVEPTRVEVGLVDVDAVSLLIGRVLRRRG